MAVKMRLNTDFFQVLPVDFCRVEAVALLELVEVGLRHLARPGFRRSERSTLTGNLLQRFLTWSMGIGRIRIDGHKRVRFNSWLFDRRF